jgi:erythromycin esterase-like protein
MNPRVLDCMGRIPREALIAPALKEFAYEDSPLCDELNVGQLCRERFGNDSALIGFGTHTGTVATASDWDEPLQVVSVRPSRADSSEQQFHLAGVRPCFVDLRQAARALHRRDLSAGHRAF